MGDSDFNCLFGRQVLNLPRTTALFVSASDHKNMTQLHVNYAMGNTIFLILYCLHAEFHTALGNIL
jgi:hypothetical protein